MATERWGIKTLDDNGYVNLHSDYSSVVYVGEMAQSTEPVRPNYLGNKAVGIGDGTKTSNYHMGYLVQYLITGIDTDFLVPFYKPNFSKQQISILDVVRKGRTIWAVNLLYSGDIGAIPRVFAFAPLNAMPIPAAVAGETGLRVYDPQGGLVFTTTKKPLRPDDVLQILHPSSIKTNGRGGCGNSGWSSSCHVDFTPNLSSTYTGTATNTSTKIYHIVPSAYGGLAYSNSGDGTIGCEWLQERKYAWSYSSWASFRGSLGHEFGTQKHISDWLGDFAGAAYDYQESDCAWGGWFGALLGAVLAYFTFGASLLLTVGVALAGWALTPVEATPSLKAYSGDQTFDTNNPSNLIITDLNYYADQGIGQLPLSFYNLTSTTTSVTEGTTVKFEVTGFNIVSGTYYWTIGNIDTVNADFVSTSGFFNISGNKGSFTVSILQDNIDENKEYFTVEIRRDSITGPILKTSVPITIPANGWIISPGATKIYEGKTTIVNVDVVNLGSISGTYYWTIDHISTTVADFTNSSGTVVISNSKGSFGINPIQDYTIETDKTFTVSVRSGSITGSIIRTTDTITLGGYGGDSYAFAVSTTRPDARFFYTPGVTEWRAETIFNSNNGAYYHNVVIYYNGYVGRYEGVDYNTTSLNNGIDNGYFQGPYQTEYPRDYVAPGVLRITESYSIVRSGG
jgi:hypothetical protein